MIENRNFLGKVALLALVSPLSRAIAQQNTSSPTPVPAPQTAAQQRAEIDAIIHSPPLTEIQRKEVEKYLRDHTKTRKFHPDHPDVVQHHREGKHRGR